MECFRDEIICHNTPGKSSPEFLKAFKAVKMNRMFVKRTVDQYKDTGKEIDRRRSGRPRSVRTPGVVNSVREKIPRNPWTNIAQMAKESKISRTTMTRVVKDDLKMIPYRLQKRQVLSALQKDKRIKRSRILLQELKSGTAQNVVNSDEKLFTAQYVTATEWAHEGGGKLSKSNRSHLEASDFRRLPFDHCALSLQPFTTPYCDATGHIYDLVHIIPYIKKFGTNPVTGRKLNAQELVKLIIHKNEKGQPHCPVLYKTFNNNSKICTIKSTGNVFSYEAVAELNIKPKHWKDLLTDDEITRADILVLQDPQETSKFNLNKFDHIRQQRAIPNPELEKAKTDPRSRLRYVNAETKQSLEELDTTFKPIVRQTPSVRGRPDQFSAAHFSTGEVATSFTSTASSRTTEQVPATLEDSVVRYAMVKKKGYVRVITNKGPLNFELHCDYVPKTCENFIKLCQKNYYNGISFHRCIRHFMIQGGDPTKTGSGGQSFWAEPFGDEFKPHLSHTGRGILSMANSGPNSNTSQFFITFRSCKHLDGKHTVFGKVVGGMETLTLLEQVNTDNKDKPLEDIFIINTVVYVDPFTDVDNETGGMENFSPAGVPVTTKVGPLPALPLVAAPAEAALEAAGAMASDSFWRSNLCSTIMASLASRASWA
eukprot:maker-scaffold1160_size58366-snap-gene-0.8 protein:Tk08357 transcript:maker-scaffold1160_size58366-snap-gene-0.8-mRNA-1 annotation:"peptidyl-prolyl cis-trans isomerase-like 2"